MAEVHLQGVVSAATVSISAKAQIRASFAVRHMLAAAHFSRAVGQIEKEHSGESFGAFFEDILHQATACVLCAVAALEAHVNEIFIDSHQYFPEVPSAAMTLIWKDLEKGSLKDKFQSALMLLGHPQMPQGESSFQDVADLIVLRNALTTPSQSGVAAIEDLKLSNRLQKRFDPSPFPTDELMFPNRWATH